MNERTITESEIRRVIARLRAVGFDEHYVCGDRAFGQTAYLTALLDVENALIGGENDD